MKLAPYLLAVALAPLGCSGGAAPPPSPPPSPSAQPGLPPAEQELARDRPAREAPAADPGPAGAPEAVAAAEPPPPPPKEKSDKDEPKKERKLGAAERGVLEGSDDEPVDLGEGGARKSGQGQARRGQSATFSVGAASVSGGVAPEVIKRVVQQSSTRLRLCYENGLRHNPALRGKVSVKFSIAKDGSVSSAVDSGSDMPDAGVVSCVVSAFRGLSFPQPDGGTTIVTYPLLFSP